jgi:hypothetical protein
VFVTNHALSGMLVGRLFKNRPGTAFAAGLASHLLLDTVPHWGCRVSKIGPKQKKASEGSGLSTPFLTMAKRDGVLGLIVLAAGTLAVERPARNATVAAMAGAVVLDLDKPLYYFFGINPFPGVIQRIHGWVQNESPGGMRNELRFGAAFAVADVFTVIQARRPG